MPRRASRGLAAVAALALAVSCKFDPAYRDYPTPTATGGCTEGVVQCVGTKLTRCENNQEVTVDDCGARQLVCAPGFLKCTPCLPGAQSCSGQTVVVCDAAGQTTSNVQTCNNATGDVCRDGVCDNLCGDAQRDKSNVGCEYWGVDLDNAVTSQGNAAAQQYAIIVSNPQPDVAANVTIDIDDAAPGTAAALRTVATATVGSQQLEVFKLGPREVDGSPPDVPNGGTGTALSRGAFRVQSNIPIVAFQFNPLDNVNVFSNDASLLLPREALTTTGTGRSYVVAGWPQTIATTTNPDTNFGTDLRAYLALVGTTPNTHVHLKTSVGVIPGGPFAQGIPAGGEVDTVLQPFDVLNLETGGFNADFTGSLIDADGPVVVYTGSEASDAPSYDKIADRECCADHLEQQLTPVRAVGKTYAIGRVPNRTKAIAAAGGAIAYFDEPELYRIVATAPATVTTTLPAPWNTFTLDSEGASVTIPALQDFTLSSTAPVLVADLQVSQYAAGVHTNTLPGGDPSLTFVPPIEQWRSDYVFLTPDKYIFDFIVITAPKAATVYLDGLAVDATLCEVAPNGPYTVYRCQLSFPVIDPTKTENNISPGKQNDGVHRVQADAPVDVIVYGFDSFVSYAYAAGTQLTDISVN